MLTGVTALAQDGVRDLPALQLFDPADIRPYDEWNAPKEGFFFDFDGIFWTISAPKKTSVGVPGGYTEVDGRTNVNSMDTGDYRAKQKDGDRLEFGYTAEHHGFLIDTFELNCQTQIIYGDYVNVVFRDYTFPPPAPGKTPGYFVSAEFLHTTISNRTETDGIEALYTYRQHQFADGGEVIWMLGGRYVRFDDEFNFTGIEGLDVTARGSECDTTVRNRIGGPELGVRYYHQFGRLSFATEGRFMAGINEQDIRQYGSLNTEVGPNVAFASSDHQTTFTPLGELRVNGNVQLTRLISFKVGWTGIVMGGIGRSSDMVNYDLPTMSINSSNNSQTVFIQGVNVGVELNR
jgi:hypothetical protein